MIYDNIPAGAAQEWYSGRGGCIVAENTCVVRAETKHSSEYSIGRRKTFTRHFTTSNFKTKPRFTIMIFCPFIRSIRRTEVCRYYNDKQNLTLVQIEHAGIETLLISYSLKIIK